MTAALRPAVSAAIPAPPSMSAGLRAALRRWGSAVWQALEAHGERRAQRMLNQVASQMQATDPALARELRAMSTRQSAAADR